MTIERNLIGAYCTSLDTTGFSITLLKVDDETLDPGCPGPHPGP
ncbi:dihydroxyacetone kinase subunit DhaK [Escherichia coli]